MDNTVQRVGFYISNDNVGSGIMTVINAIMPEWINWEITIIVSSVIDQCIRHISYVKESQI